MFDLVFFLVTALPLIGIALMEAGAYGPDVGDFGFANGASAAYMLHLGVLYATYAVVRVLFRRRSAVTEEVAYPNTQRLLRRLGAAVLAVEMAILIFSLFGVGAIHVLTGELDKSDLRSQLGSLGALAYLSRDFLAPSCFAVLAFVYHRSATRGKADTLLLGICFLLTAMNGGVWGFRAAAVLLVTPGLMFLVPKLGPLRAIACCVGAFAVFTLFSMLFQQLSFSLAAATVGIRASLGTGNSAWKLWDLAVSHNTFPPYWPTLFTALGGRLASVLGVYQRTQVDVSTQYDYTALTTLLVKNFDANTDAVMSNVTGTVFGEGVFALGTRWYWVYSILAGLIVGACRVGLDRAVDAGRPVLSALLATYFITSVFTWLNAGGLVALLQIPFVVNYGLAALLITGLLRMSAGDPVTRGNVEAVRA